MKIDVLTLFPEMFAPLKESILKRATENNKIEINVIDFREYSKNKHKKCDDYTYGGGAGMLLSAQPIADCIMDIDKEHNAKRIYLSPKGKLFNQNMAKEMCASQHIILLCGHYEGVDERVIELFIDEEISIGDYILTGGELPAMVVCDTITRLIDGVISGESLEVESLEDNLLEYPQYTRPQEFMGLSVPEVLISGNHKEIEKWRNEKRLEITKKNRPDLLNKK